MSGEAVEAKPEPLTRDSLERLALGRLGLRPHEWVLYTPREFFNAVEGFNDEKRESEVRELRRLRLALSVIISTRAHQKKWIKPEKIIPLEGDKGSFKPKGYSAEERKAIEERFKRASEKTKQKTKHQK